MSFEGLESRTELKSEWRSNPLPNNTVPGAIRIKLPSNVTYIVAESHKDRAWPIFLLFQNLFPLTFCWCCNCCLSHSFLVLAFVSVACLCCAPTFSCPLPERDLAVPAMSLKWPGALQHSHFPGDGRVYGLKWIKVFLYPGANTTSINKRQRALCSTLSSTTEYLKTGMLFPGIASPGNVSTLYTWQKPSLEREIVILLHPYLPSEGWSP